MDEKSEHSNNLSPSTRRGRIGGLGGVFTLILLVGWSWGEVAAGVAIPRGHPPHSSSMQILQDIPAPSSSDEWSVSELAELLANAEPQERERKLASLFEWMHQLRQQQQHEQEEAAMVAAIESEMASQALSNGGNARIAMPPPLLHSSTSAATGGTSSRVSPPAGQLGATAGGEDDGDDDGKGKRGSFMSLCHFKICNMGRKRNLRYNPWTRV